MTQIEKKSRSVSQLNLYTDCAQQFYLERTHRPRLPKRPAAWTARGIAVHEAAMTWELSNRKANIVDLAVEVYDATIREFIASQPDYNFWMTTPMVKKVDTDITKRREDTIKQVQDYADYALASEWEILTLPDGSPGIEVEFEDIVGEVKVRGTIDLLLQWPDGSVTVRDIKTGQERKKNYQLGIYKFFAQKIFSLDIDKGDYFYTKLNRSSGWIDLSRYDESYVTALFRDLDRSIEADLYLPSPGKNCDLCPVAPWCAEMGWLPLPQED